MSFPLTSRISAGYLKNPKLTDGAGTRTTGYGSNLQLLTETHDGLVDRVLTRTYDGLGRSAGFELGTSLDPDADHEVVYGYDDAGRLGTVTGHGTTHTYGYVTNSNLIAGVSSTSPSGFAVINTYDTKRDVLLTKENKIGATSISKYDYTVNRIGQRTERAQSGSAFSATNADAFTYNAAGELTGSTNDTVTGRSFSYAFDGIGNRAEATELGVTIDYSFEPEATDPPSPNLLNQYTKIGVGSAVYQPLHDEDGNMTVYFRPSDGKKFDVVWDGENRLVGFTPATPTSGDLKGEYEYDGQSRRVRKVLSEWSGSAWVVEKEERFFYDGWNMIAVYDDTEALVETYTWGLDLSGSLQGAGGIGGLLSRKPYGGNAAFYSFDGNGNVSELINISGSVIAHYEYGPFGQVVSATGADAASNRYQFSSKWQDEESGFNYYGYRFYNPETGRWVSRDTIGERGGANLYSMIANQPVYGSDYLGKMFQDFEGYKLSDEYVRSGNSGVTRAVAEIQLDDCKCANEPKEISGFYWHFVVRVFDVYIETINIRPSVPPVRRPAVFAHERIHADASHAWYNEIRAELDQLPTSQLHRFRTIEACREAMEPYQKSIMARWDGFSAWDGEHMGPDWEKDPLENHDPL